MWFELKMNEVKRLITELGSVKGELRRIFKISALVVIPTPQRNYINYYYYYLSSECTRVLVFICRPNADKSEKRFSLGSISPQDTLQVILCR